MSKVYLVGAGPFGKDYITQKGLDAIKEADVIVYDNLIDSHILEENERAEKIYSGKIMGEHSAYQDEINVLLYEKASEGKTVVRLKGGDPFVFGRGGEEAMYLKERKIACEIIPGLSSGLSALTLAGIPASHRGLARSIHLITGHDLKSSVDFKKYKDLDGTLIFYMSVSSINKLARELIEAGFDENTPLAVIYKAASPEQETRLMTLREAEKVDQDSLKRPSIIAVGSVIALRDKIYQEKDAALKGLRIAATRESGKNNSLKEEVEKRGGSFISLSTIKTEAIAAPLKELLESENPTIVLSSQNGVKYFFNSFFKDYDIRQLAGFKFLVIGEKTKSELEKYHIKADYIASDATSYSLASFINKNELGNIFIVRPKNSPGLIKKLVDKNKRVSELILYETVREAIAKETLLSILKEPFDYILFTSTSTVESLFTSLDCCLSSEEKASFIALIKTRAISIGPLTSQTLKKYGISPKESHKKTIESMLDVIERK